MNARDSADDGGRKITYTRTLHLVFGHLSIILMLSNVSVVIRVSEAMPTDRVLASAYLVFIAPPFPMAVNQVFIIYPSLFTDLIAANAMFTPEDGQYHWNASP